MIEDRKPQEPETKRELTRLGVVAALTAFFYWLFGREREAARHAEEREREVQEDTAPFAASLKRRGVKLPDTTAIGHETRDLSPRAVAAFGCGLLVALAGMLIVTLVWLGIASGKGPPLHYPPTNLANAPGPTLPPEPRLDAVPAQGYQQFYAQEQQILNSYGWVDQKAGIVRIPISRAMDMLLSRGLPTRPSAQSQQFHDPGDQVPSRSSSGRVMEKVGQ